MTMAEPNESAPRESDRILGLQADFEGTFDRIVERLQDQGIARSDAITMAGARFDTLIENSRGPVFDAEGIHRASSGLHRSRVS